MGWKGLGWMGAIAVVPFAAFLSVDLEGRMRGHLKGHQSRGEEGVEEGLAAH
jgi:hypothetical protein